MSFKINKIIGNQVLQPWRTILTVVTQQAQPQQTNQVRVNCPRAMELHLYASYTKYKAQAAPRRHIQPATFTNDEPRIPKGTYPKWGLGAKPTEVAAFLTNPLSFSPSVDRQRDLAQVFLQTLREHRGDPKWTQQFFQALGAKKTSELISDALIPGTFKYADQKQIDASLNLIRDVLPRLAKGGLFNQADMNKLVANWTKGGNFNWFLATEVFAKLPPSQENIKNMFFTAAVQTANRMDGSGGNVLAAGAAHVLASTSADNQTQRLYELQQAKQLSPFIAKAMAGETEVPTFSSAAESIRNFTRPTFEKYGQMESLLLNAAYSDIRDGWDHKPVLLSAADRSKLRMELFNAVAQALMNNRIESNFKDNTTFKDAVSALYMREYAAIMKSGLGPNNAASSDMYRKQMQKFFEFTLFTQPSGYSSNSLATFISDRMAELRNGLLDASPQADRNFNMKFGELAHDGTLSREQGAHILGEQIGLLAGALDAAIAARGKKAQSGADALKTILGIAFSFVPGVGAGAKVGTVGAGFLLKLIGKVEDVAKDKIKNMTAEQAKEYLLEKYEMKADAIVARLHEELRLTIPAEEDDDFLAAYQAGYADVRTSE